MRNGIMLALALYLSGMASVVWADADVDLKIYGSNTVGAELAPAIVKQWMQQKGFEKVSEQHEGTELIISGSNAAGKSIVVELDARGSSTGFKAVQKGDADLAMSSRPIKPAEVAALKSLGHCDTVACEYVLALDGIAVIVNAANPLTNLDRKTLMRLFSGEIKDWKDIGGKPGPVNIYALDSNSGTYDTFRSLVLGKANLVSSAKRDSSHISIADMVAKDVNGIGFVGLPFVAQNKRLAVADGESHPIEPTPFSVATEDYVLSRRLYFYLPEFKATPLARSFVEYAVGHGGQLVAEQAGFVSQAISAGEVVLDESMPEEYRQLTAGAKRLSVNFRFQPGSPKLDSKAQRDLMRLKEYIKKQGKKKPALMLFGFADSNESMPIVSLQLSVDRADTVADLLLQEGITPAKVRGFGNAVPVASNETNTGRAKNRRVEVWIR